MDTCGTGGDNKESFNFSTATSILLSTFDIKVSKLAQGLPVGGEIESLDDGTLISAFKNRKGLISESD